jgi:hypothetical protein
MSRTTEEILRAQEQQAAQERQRPKPRMPQGLTPLQKEQWRSWGWCDQRQRGKAKFYPPADKGENVMGLGKRKSSAMSYYPIVKIDCRDGKITRCDRVQEDGEWKTKPAGIPFKKFDAVFDLPGMKIGWLNFDPPDFQLVPVGQDIGDQPTDKHREGFKLRLLLRNGSGEGVHELASTAAALWQSMDELHDDWEDGKAKHKGKLPVVGITEMVKTTTRSGTGYRPSFAITSWVPTPPEFAVQPESTTKKRNNTSDFA